MPAHAFSHSPRQLTDCGLCPAAQRCWGDVIASSSGFLVRRHAEIGSGTPLFCQGDRFAGLYIVASGYIKLIEASAEGSERILALCLPGDLVGIEGWTHGCYPYTALAAGAARLCQLHWSRPKHATHSVLLLERLLRKTAAQLDCSTRVWSSLPAVDRVAGLLAWFAKRTGAALEPPLTRREIGSLLGLAEETVVRAIRVLRQRKQSGVEGKHMPRLTGAP